MKRDQALSKAREQTLRDTIVYETETMSRLTEGQGQPLPGPQSLPGPAKVLSARRLSFAERQTPGAKAVADAILKLERVGVDVVVGYAIRNYWLGSY